MKKLVKKIREVDLYLFLGLSFYIFLFLLRFLKFEFFISSSWISYNNDAFYWSWCAKELAEKGHVDFENPALFSNGRNLYFQGCFFSIGYTLILLTIFKLFGINLRIVQVLIFLIMVINLKLFYDILMRISNDKFVAGFVFLILIINPFTTIFSFKIRPDPFALMFILLSIKSALNGRALASATSYFIGVFLFKTNYFILIFVILHFLFKSSKNKINSMLKFLTNTALFSTIYLISVYLPIKETFPQMIDYLMRSNSIPLNRTLSIKVSHLSAFLPNYLGLISTIGILMYLGTLLIYPLNRRVFPIEGARSFTFLLAILGLAELSNKIKFFKKILPFLFIAYLPISFAFLEKDFIQTKIENELSKKIISEAKTKRICSSNTPVSGFLLVFYPTQLNKQESKNLAYKFIFSSGEIDINNISDCDIILVLEDHPITIPSDKVLKTSITTIRLRDLLKQYLVKLIPKVKNYLR